MAQVHRMRFHKDGTVRSWKKSDYGRRWSSENTKPEFGTGSGSWDLETDDNLLFEATHYSSIVAGLRRIGLGGSIEFPNKPIAIEHQYWIHKNHQSRSFVGSMHQTAYSGLREKHKHVHKIVFKRVGAPMSGNGRTLVVKCSSVMPASHLADLLEAKKTDVERAGNPSEDIRDTILDVVSSIGEFFAS